jgi:dihydropteroate synthase
MGGAVWRIRGGALPLDRPRILGVLNVTPDSFSDGGRYTTVDAALAHARRLVAEGADVLDVGGESTRPGADPVSVEEELRRVVPVLERLRRELPGVPVSIDTAKPEVAEAALRLGAHVVNDVTGLSQPAMVDLVARWGAGAVVMHMRGTPKTMQDNPVYDDVVAEVAAFLRSACAEAEAAGVPRAALVVDPGLGFGKTVEHNWTLLRRLPELAATGYPVLVGPSRKRFLGAALGVAAPPEARDVATAAVCALAWVRGARLFRVHAVAPARDALAVAYAFAPEVS